MRSFDGVHKDKIQSVQWNDKEATVLLNGSYDRTVGTFDTRAPELCLGAAVGGDVGSIRVLCLPREWAYIELRRTDSSV